MQYWIQHVLHKIDSLMLTTNERRYQVLSEMQRELIHRHSSGLQAEIWPGVPLYGLVPLQQSQYWLTLLLHVFESPWVGAYSNVSCNLASLKCTHAWQNDWTHPGPVSLSSSGTSNASSNPARFATSITLLMTSLFCSMCWTYSHNAQSTSGLVTMCGRFLDNTLAFDLTCASISERCCSLCDSVDWVKINGPSGLVAKYLTTSTCLIGWGRVSTYA